MSSEVVLNGLPMQLGSQPRAYVGGLRQKVPPKEGENTRRVQINPPANWNHMDQIKPTGALPVCLACSLPDSSFGDFSIWHHIHKGCFRQFFADQSKSFWVYVRRIAPPRPHPHPRR